MKPSALPPTSRLLALTLLLAACNTAPTPSPAEPAPVPSSALAALPPGTGLNATYFDNKDLTGTTVRRTDAQLNFDWKSAGPAQGIAADSFSARWTGQIAAPQDGDYTLRTRSDDGVRLWIDGKLAIDNWTNHSPTNNDVVVRLKGGVQYNLKVEYYENGGGAVAQLLWIAPGAAQALIVPTANLYTTSGSDNLGAILNPPPSTTPTPTPTPPTPTPTKGLNGAYYDTIDFTGPALVRTDAQLNFNWGSAGPAASIAPDTFSARWTGQLLAPTTGTYSLSFRSDDGARVWLDGKLVIDHWTSHAAADRTAVVRLVGGQKYNLRVEYYNNAPGAVARLSWLRPGSTTKFETVPDTNLITSSGPDNVGAEILSGAAALPPTGRDLAVTVATVSQAIQTDVNDVPLMAGRAAFVRAFVLAGQDGLSAGTVRLEARANGASLGALTLNGPATAPLVRDDSSLVGSFNVMLPAEWVKPGLEVRVVADASNAVAESNENNNAFPPSGGWLSLDVRPAKPWAITFVPVFLSASNKLYTVTPADVEAKYLKLLRATMPIKDITFNIRAPYTFTGNVGNATDYSNLLYELYVLRRDDGGNATYFPHYYGVMNTGAYGGIAYIGFPVSLGRPEGTFIHEIGHNFTMRHTPCGASGEYAYPYPDAGLNFWGLDLATLTLKSPSHKDYMSYCGPEWTSDYTWKKITKWRADYDRSVAPTSAASASSTVAPPSTGLTLQVGAVVQGGEVRFQPAFARVGAPFGTGELSARSVGAGFTVEALDAAGRVLASAPAEVLEISTPHEYGVTQSSGHAGHAAQENARQVFAALSLSPEAARQTATLRLRQGGAVIGQRSARAGELSAQSASGVAVRAQRRADGSVVVTWDAGTYGEAEVRSSDGRGLGRGSGGTLTVLTNTSTLQVALSDGVRSFVRAVDVRP